MAKRNTSDCVDRKGRIRSFDYPLQKPTCRNSESERELRCLLPYRNCQDTKQQMFFDEIRFADTYSEAVP
jgi:hypothetical protein